MTTPEIQSFLAICRYKTVTHAAEHLFISQSSLSTRLRTLERELGGMLFYRKKGSREMLLTATGKAFFDLAVQYESVIKQMEQLCKKQPLNLRVSSLNSLSTYLMPAAYEAFLQEHPDVELELQDKELDAASESIRHGLTDMAFVTGSGTEPGTTGFHAFTEPMVLICAKESGFPSLVDLKTLPYRTEVYVPWCLPFVQWHQTIFGIGSQPQVSISTMEQLRLFMKRENSWAVVPVSVADGLERTCDIRRCETTVSLPSRDVFCVMAEKDDNPAIGYFLTCLKATLKSQPKIDIKF